MAINGIAVSDFQGLSSLKALANKDEKRALPEVAKQFEAIFLQSMLKSMRLGEHFLDEDSPFKGKSEETFRDMLDGQYAESIANTKGIGLSAMLTAQVERQYMPTLPVDSQSVIKPDIEKPLVDNLSIRPLNTENAQVDLNGHASSIDEFVKSIWPYARQAASVLGIDPKLLIAQAALETGWGKSVAKGVDGISSNNLFNIKSFNPDESAVSVNTTEYIADNPIKVTAAFRHYETVEHSFNDYVSMIKSSDRYQSARQHADNPERFVKELHQAGFATDPKYDSKILSIYRGDALAGAIERNGLVKT